MAGRARGLLIALALLPGMATAQDLPALFDVTGVEAQDVLNVREAPDAGAAALGALAPDATGVEVMDRRDGWGLVNAGPRAGWASLRYLAPVEPDAEVLTRRLHCTGTEPFWSLGIEQGVEARFALAGAEPERFDAGTLQPAEGRRDVFFLPLDAEGPGVILHRGQCSDGMSDRAYGLSVDVLRKGGTLYAGCCSLR